MISQETFEIVMENASTLDSAIIYDRDFHYQYFGFKTLERSYLLKINGKIAERPQHLLMRVAIGIHGRDIDRALQTYNLMSERYFTHASPTMFNAGTPHPQMSSCFLVCMKDDSIEGIYDTLKQCAMISKTAGGIGLNIHNIRATGFVSSYETPKPFDNTEFNALQVLHCRHERIFKWHCADASSIRCDSSLR